jgi:EAL domain-containing protein (putative c-di-GMP-specific phosphodiesterase class I)
MEDAETSVITLRALKEIGVRLAIDDFGSDYFSFPCLVSFRVV